MNEAVSLSPHEASTRGATRTNDDAPASGEFTRTTPPRRPSDAPALKRSMFPGIVSKGMLAAAHVQTRVWDLALRYLEATQMFQLRSIVRHAADTEFGRAHGFKGIRRYEDFQSRVPIGDYDSFWPSIERMMKGETGLLVPEMIRYYGNSSGSSTKGKSKFLPVCERQIRHQIGSAADPLMRHLARTGDDSFASGFTLGLLPPGTMKEQGPVLITSNPALMSVKKPFVTKAVWLPSEATRDISDYDKKLDRIAEENMDHDVRAIVGTTCWFSLMFDKLLAAARRRGRDVRTVGELWPNLKILIGGGVSADPYLPVIRSRMGHDGFSLIDTYNATEGGIYAASDGTGERGMLMIPHRGVFFEFVPLEEHDAPSPTRVPLWGVVKDKLYTIVVTTPSGLYAYKLGDIVRFPSISPLRMEFAGRLSGCLSTTQELTTHVEIERATERALRDQGLTSVDFGCAADVGVSGSKSRYVLFVELVAGAAPVDVARFAAAFDAGLCEQNRVYREHRVNNVGILAPEVVVLPSGSVRRFMQDAGLVSVQTKFPRILDDERKLRLRSYV